MKNQNVKNLNNGSEQPIASIVLLDKFPDPLKQNPKLMCVKLHEDPTSPLTDDEWPEELK